MRELEYPSYPSVGGPRLEWSAIFAGTALCLAVMFLLSMLGVSIGFLAAPAGESAASIAKGVGIGGAIWVLATGIVSFYIGGWTASRLSTSGRPADGVLYGLVSWSAATLVALFMVTTFVGGLFGTMASAASSAASAGASAAASDARPIEERIRSAGDELRQQWTRAQQQTQDRAQAPGGGAGEPRGQQASQAAGGVGLFGFLLMGLEMIAAALGGRAGARLYLPVPVSEYRSARREPASVR